MTRHILTFLTAALLLGAGAGRAQDDPGFADTVYVGDAAWEGGGAIGLPVDLVNDEQLAGISLGFHWDDALLICDSVSYNTARVGSGQANSSIVNINQTVLTSVLFLTDAWWAAGTGEYCTIWFHYDGLWDVSSEVNVDSVSVVPGGEYLLVDYTTAAGFVPQTIPGRIFGFSAVDSDTDHPGMPSTRLLPCYPNPFNPSTTIAFSIGKRDRVRLEVIDILGRKVKTLVDRVLPPGTHDTIWHGRDDDGRRVSSGVYFYRLRAGEYVQSRALVLVK